MVYHGSCNFIQIIPQQSYAFDAGPSDHLVIDNVKQMGVDLKEVDAVVPSHGNFDQKGAKTQALLIAQFPK